MFGSIAVTATAPRPLHGLDMYAAMSITSTLNSTSSNITPPPDQRQVAVSYLSNYRLDSCLTGRSVGDLGPKWPAKIYSVLTRLYDTICFILARMKVPRLPQHIKKGFVRLEEVECLSAKVMPSLYKYNCKTLRQPVRSVPLTREQTRPPSHLSAFIDPQLCTQVLSLLPSWARLPYSSHPVLPLEGVPASEAP